MFVNRMSICNTSIFSFNLQPYRCMCLYVYICICVCLHTNVIILFYPKLPLYCPLFYYLLRLHPLLNLLLRCSFPAVFSPHYFYAPICSWDIVLLYSSQYLTSLFSFRYRTELRLKNLLD